MIWVNFSHLKKASSFIEVTDEGIEICVKNEYSWKAHSPIILINCGIFIVMFGFAHRRVSKISHPWFDL